MENQASSLEEFCAEFAVRLEQRGFWDTQLINDFMQAEAVIDQLRIHAGKLAKVKRLCSHEEWLTRLWQEVHRCMKSVPANLGNMFPNYFRKLCMRARFVVFQQAEQELGRSHYEGTPVLQLADPLISQLEQSDLMDCVRLQMGSFPLLVQNLIKAHIMSGMSQVQIAELIGKKKSRANELIIRVKTDYLPRLRRLIEDNCLGGQV